MKVHEFLSSLEKIFPNENALPHNQSQLVYGEYKKERNINKILLTIELSIGALYTAVKEKFDLILSLNPLMYHNYGRIIEKALLNKLTLLTKYPVLIYHLNPLANLLEYGPCGLIASLLSFQVAEILTLNKGRHPRPVGILCTPLQYPQEVNSSMTLQGLLNRISSQIHPECIEYAGNEAQILSVIGIIFGFTHITRELITKCKKKQCGTLVVSNIFYHTLQYLLEQNFSLIKIPIWDIYNIFLKKLKNALSLKYPFTEVAYFKAENPVKHICNHDPALLKNMAVKLNKRGEEK
jgi:putative NIF3 family GTP cyclohydrolase 1 type 2